MRDINFFSSFATSKVSLIKTPEDAKRLRISIIVIAIISLIHVSIAIYSGYNTLEIKRIDKFFQMQTTKDTINAIATKKAQILELEKYNKLLMRAKTAITSKSTLNDKIITAINNTMPADIILTTLAVTTDSVTLKGISPKEINVAELQHNLNSLAFVQSVQVSEIKEDEKVETGSLVFLIDCKLSGGVK